MSRPRFESRLFTIFSFPPSLPSPLAIPSPSPPPSSRSVSQLHPDPLRRDRRRVPRPRCRRRRRLGTDRHRPRKRCGIRRHVPLFLLILRCQARATHRRRQRQRRQRGVRFLVRARSAGRLPPSGGRERRRWRNGRWRGTSRSCCCCRRVEKRRRRRRRRNDRHGQRGQGSWRWQKGGG